MEILLIACHLATSKIYTKDQCILCPCWEYNPGSSSCIAIPSVSEKMFQADHSTAVHDPSIDYRFAVHLHLLYNPSQP